MDLPYQQEIPGYQRERCTHLIDAATVLPHLNIIIVQWPLILLILSLLSPLLSLSAFSFFGEIILRINLISRQEKNRMKILGVWSVKRR